MERRAQGSGQQSVYTFFCTSDPYQRSAHWASANTKEGTRLDIAANGFWGGCFERAYFDVRVFNPHAPLSRQQSLPATYRTHERAKVLAYEQRVRELEHGSFTPLVMSHWWVAANNLLQKTGFTAVQEMGPVL